MKNVQPPPATSAAGDRLDLMQTFVRIVEAGSLSGAAAQLNTTQPTVSRRLQALERTLGVRLLQRSTRAMRLTEDGERCFERAKVLLENWEAFEAELRGVGDEPKGSLRVLAPHAFGQEQFVRPLAEFLHAHPLMSVEWLLRDDVHDMIGEGIDCALQVGEVRDPAVVAIKLVDVPRIVVASPAVLQGAPVPQHAQALSDLPWLALRTYYRNEVSLTHAATGEIRQFAIRPRLSSDNLYVCRNAALAGLGAVIVSAWMVADDIAAGRLLRLAPEWQAPSLPLYLTYPYARFYPARLRRFVAAMREAAPLVLQGAAVAIIPLATSPGAACGRA
ncbi:LysR family transcriptional regulator [Hydrogenophaga sp. Root209]|uniref:LysR family transcriptional regulator n=1 Tax=Hydrogenophaga sp. Root209 TaxID=1736490 RepID=UPI0006F3D8E5|nr:LysR family transcriptional regulator [Hydrogenophaga sp. Root209]KRC08642.1 LysR family transcriptional regulator [Hydrogenophaga sp. Root209]